MTGWVKVAVALGLVSLAIIAAFVLPAGDWAGAFVEWARAAGVKGVLAFALVGVVSAVFIVPGAMLGIGAGMAYGPFRGLLLVSPVSVLAATIAFGLGRTVARSWIARWAASSPGFQAVDRVIGQHGFKIVVLVRLSPFLPYNALNYALGLTDVRVRDYVLGSFIGMLPGTFLYVYIGSLVGNLASVSRGTAEVSAARYVLWAIGLVATLAVTGLVTRLARGALFNEASPEGPSTLRRGQRP
jgi:uncharacterized membrane protein YdjX (TVP38/TMEM64 family)